MAYLWEILRYVGAWGGTISDHLVLVLDVLHRDVLDHDDRTVGCPRDWRSEAAAP